MKSKGEILQKLKQVRYRHIKKGIRKGLSRQPQNCAHNRQIDLILGLRVCSHANVLDTFLMGSELPVCDAENGPDQSKTCDYFCPARDKSEIREQIKTRLNSKEVGEIAFHYPDVAALIWVLDDKDLEGFEDLEEDFDMKEAQVIEDDEEDDFELYTLEPITLDDVGPKNLLQSWWVRIKSWWVTLF